MKRTIFFAIMTTFFLCLLTCACSETIVYYGGIDPDNGGYSTFFSKHSDAKLEQVQQYYQTESEFTGALVTGEFQCDLFQLYSDSFDWSSLIDKQYCMDLSSSEVISAAMARMYPSIAQIGMKDGHIYAVPTSIIFEYIEINEEAWELCGFSDEDIPQSFPQFLDFLDRWCKLVEQEEVPAGVRAWATFDAALYSESTYTQWLTSLLIDHYIMQTQYNGKTIDFSDETLLTLLERCMVTGKRIYEVEPGKSEYDSGTGMSLFKNNAQNVWPQTAGHIVSLRLDENSPKIIKGALELYAIYSNATNPELALELLEDLVTGPESPYTWDNSFLYQDGEAKINNNYESDVQSEDVSIVALEEKLNDTNLTGTDREDVESELETRKKLRAELELDSYKYYVSPAQLEDYQNYADALYFPSPNVFNTSSAGYRQVKDLESQYASGVITAEKLLQELGRIARMMELENE